MSDWCSFDAFTTATEGAAVEMRRHLFCSCPGRVQTKPLSVPGYVLALARRRPYLAARELRRGMSAASASRC
eukprot:1729967-Pyramimonas_sp.AAC.1